MTAFMAAHLWQSTIVVGLAAAVAWFLRGNRARTRHVVWTLASVKFLLPFAALVAAGEQLSILPGMASLSGRAAAQLPDAPGMIDWFEAVQPFPFAALPAAASPAGPAAASNIPAIVFALWLAGMLLVLGVWLSRWMAVKRLLRASAPLIHGREADILTRVADSAGLASIPLLASTGPMEPGVVGCVGPVILWPLRISERMTDEQIAAIMLHELVHVGRRDNLLSAVHMVVEAVFWFHPLVWYVGARLLDAREEACDEEVVRLGADPAQYAEGILQTCEYAAESRLACVAGVTGADLKRRVAAIVRHRAARLGTVKLAVLTSLGVACAAGPIAAGALTNATTDGPLAIPPPIALPHASIRPVDPSAARAGVRSQAGPPAPQAPATPAAKAEADLKFEVASIKLIRENDGGGGTAVAVGPGGVLIPPGSLFRFAGAIENLIQQAYGVPRVQIFDGPDWIREDWNNYTIQAKLPDGVARTPENMRAMLRALLVERFKIVVREEERMLPVYVLVHAREDKRLGPKLKPSDCPQHAPWEPHCMPRMGLGRNASGQNSLFERWAPALQTFLGRPVIDRTGITGPHTWEVGQFAPGGAALTPEDPSFFTAIQENLGLKLQTDRAPLRVVVIQSIERPTEN